LGPKVITLNIRTKITLKLKFKDQQYTLAYVNLKERNQDHTPQKEGGLRRRVCVFFQSREKR